MDIFEKSNMVSRRRHARALTARLEAEALLDTKSRELWDVNQQLKVQAENLEKIVKQRTNELKSAMLAAQAANQAKSIFLANMSHEIRTPLNGVLGMAEALQEHSLNQEQSNMVDIIQSSGQLLLSVLNDILDISKIESGQMEIEELPFKLDELFVSLQQLYAPKAAEKGLELSVHFLKDADKWVLGDPTRLRQIVGNLVSNAIKFTKVGGVRIEVDLSLMTVGCFQLKFHVKDTGEGVPENRLFRLFKSFSQVDSSIARKYGGTGLGLAISKQLCELLDGEISVTSIEGQGSVFSVELPLKPSQKPKPRTEAIEDAAILLNSKRWRILLAEDNRTNQIVFKKLLKGYDLEIEVAKNGKLAVESFKNGEFDVVMMDINMPLMSGIEATEAIRKFEKDLGKSPVPICALTANTMKQQVEQYMATGFDSHMGKPINKADLLTGLNALLS